MKIWLTVDNNTDKLIPIEVYPDWEIGTVKAVIEAEVQIPVSNQLLFYYDTLLSDISKTVQHVGIADGDTLSVISNKKWTPARLAKGLEDFNTAESAERGSAESAAFNIEAQRKIEELINRENIIKNMYEALEYNPESFAQVTMLYIDISVNEHPIKAFVDSGAQATIMSMALAEKCGLTRLIDKRFKGTAQGVGTSQFVGRIHNVGMRFSDDLVVPCSITVLESCTVDFLLGLDMLKRHTACIDLKQNGLVLYEKLIPFLPEHQIPKTQLHSAPLSETGSDLSSLKAQFCSNESVETLKNLGASEEQAAKLLIQARGNVEIAASLLFQ